MKQWKRSDIRVDGDRNKIIVKGIPPEWYTLELPKMLADVGEVASVDVNEHKNKVFVQYTKSESAAKSVQLYNKCIIEGYYLNSCSYSDEKPQEKYPELSPSAENPYVIHYSTEYAHGEFICIWYNLKNRNKLPYTSELYIKKLTIDSIDQKTFEDFGGYDKIIRIEADRSTKIVCIWYVDQDDVHQQIASKNGKIYKGYELKLYTKPQILTNSNQRTVGSH